MASSSIQTQHRWFCERCQCVSAVRWTTHGDWTDIP